MTNMQAEARQRATRRQALCGLVAGVGAGLAGLRSARAQEMVLPFASSSQADAPPINGVYDWHALPPTPTGLEQDNGDQMMDSGMVPGQGRAQIYYCSAGQGAPVVLLHDSLANSDYVSGLARALLRARCRVVVIDMRGHGRSTMGSLPLSYDLLADDVVTVLAYLRIRKAAFVGWGDGAVQALNIAMRHPGMVAKLFAFAPHTTPDGLKAAGRADDSALKAFEARAKQEYRHLSSTPRGFSDLQDAVDEMHRYAPTWTDADLVRITAPLWVVVADRDQLVDRAQCEHLAATVEGAGLMMLPNVSHFAPLQNPLLFALATESFLGGR
nr:alpha/beta hydrolase [uncultured Acetobacter sp.]